MEMIKGSFAYLLFESDMFRIIECRGEKGSKFFAKGNCLPLSPGITLVLYGDWVVSQNRKTFDVDHFDVEMPADESSISAYLGSLHCGIGDKTAHKLYEQYGASIWNVLEQHPEELLYARGCKHIDLGKLISGYNETISQRQLWALFQGIPGVTPQQIQRLLTAMGANALSSIQLNPYIICRYGIGFQTADELAKKLLFDRERPERIGAALHLTLKKGQQSGHLYLPVSQVIGTVAARIRDYSRDMPRKPDQLTIQKTIDYLHGKELYNDNGSVYTIEAYQEEGKIAVELARLVGSRKPQCSKMLDSYIRNYETDNNIRLDKMQIEAIIASFQTCVHVITGGPGTGKTTILKAIMYCHEKIGREKRFEANPLLLAPTGRAARRMSEATGYPAATIHRQLCLYEGADPTMLQMLDASLVVVDESSMIDNHLASILFSRIPSGTQIILVGDVDQLPSVGAGSVLREIISSNSVPVTRLDTIHRQAKDNPIIVNAARIRNGETDILTDPQKFVFLNVIDRSKLLYQTCKLYRKCVRQVGIDNVVLLNPTREKGEICSDALNTALQSLLNPQKTGEMELNYGKFTFRVSDKVMQTKNTEKVANGDVGYITAIYEKKDEETGRKTICAGIRFSDITVEYQKKDFMYVTLAYCTTVHKSQGSEYDTVLLICHPDHRNMNKKNLVYTAITRGKNRVCVIGSKDSFCEAIATDTDEMRRNTKLASRIREARGQQK